MASLLAKVRGAVGQGRFVIGWHANRRLRERRVHAWQVIEGLAEARLLRERPADRPNPCIELEQLLPDGTAIKVVWAWIESQQTAKLVTVHYFDV